MTRVQRTEPAPAILQEEGLKATQAHCGAHPEGLTKLKADAAIYGHASVKVALRAMQGGKCAYCEATVHDNPGTIDHFRPAGAVQQAPGDPIQRPGYFWLAYQWENLLLACIDCNLYSKWIYFPLADPTQRALSPNADLAREVPLLIDPAAEEPADYLQFREELLEAIDGNQRGQTTICVLRLNDEKRALLGHRRLRLQNLRALHDLIAISSESPKAVAARELIVRAIGPDGEYRAMMKQAFR